MPKLLIGNVDNEHQVRDVSGYTREERSEIILCNQRMMWLAEPGDMLVVPTPPDPEIVAYWAELNSCSPNDLEILAPAGNGNGPVAFLRQDVMFDQAFLETCRLAIENRPPNWRPEAFLAYFADNYAAEFASRIGVPVRDPFLYEGRATLLNQKTVFRKLAAGIGSALPEGRVCDNAADLRRAIKHFVGQGADFIVKMDRQAGGFGNFIVHGPRSTGKQLGSSTVFSYRDASDADQLCAEVIRRIDEPAVVERYVDTQHVLYSEYLIEGPGRYRLMNDGTMDMKPLWVGFEIPGTYPTAHRMRFLDESARIVSVVSQMGYRGYINIDGLVAENQVFLNEINGRCGGCSHVFETARRLFGSDVLTGKHIKTYNHGYFTRRGDLVAALEKAGLLLRKGDQAGIVPFNVDYELTGTFEFMAVASTVEEARALCDLALSATTADKAA
ncbi:hypothetical protein [Roseibium litorale]|uniref:ATP-grasp domain-containing protein n=1 Tax=Roseibium litorale TaxID=2803841 RepID=A0ABR9CLX4_9HYPH|nr:hypothetical protein [Roseibium litorale]MBD8891311.1 hypothetical protein [Roseibium litorale]